MKPKPGKSGADSLPPAFPQAYAILGARLAMESIQSRHLRLKAWNGSAATPSEPVELMLLREENKQLRELVTQLSQIVLRNVVDRQ
jgi:hypothetical protein